MQTLRLEHEKARQAAREEFQQQRQRARDMLLERDQQLAALRAQLKQMAPSASGASATAPAAYAGASGAQEDKMIPSAHGGLALGAAARSDGGGVDGAPSACDAAADGSVASDADHRVKRLQEMLRAKEVLQTQLQQQIAELQKLNGEYERDLRRVEGANLEYLKNVMVRYMETGEHEALFPVIATILQFSPAEVERVKKRRTRGGVLGLLPFG
jgi:hypothetical protein